MGWRGWWRRLPLAGPRSRSSETIEAELEHHLEERADALMAEGASPDEARREARRRFGDARRIRRLCEDARRSRARARSVTAQVGSFADDLRQVWRGARRAPRFTLAVVLTLGLGIGATTTFFTLVDRALLDPLPYEAADRLVKLKSYHRDRGVPSPGQATTGESYPDLVDLRSGTDVFSSLAAFRQEHAVLVAGGEPVRVGTRFVEPELFEVFGMPAALGRTLVPGERDAIVLGDAVWRSRFGADPGVVGQTVALDGQPRVIVGVMPPEFLADPFLLVYDLPVVWVSLADAPDGYVDERWRHVFHAYGRLADGVGLAQARAALRVATDRIHRTSAAPEFIRTLTLWAVPLDDEIAGYAGPVLWPLLGASGLLLLITCANVANLQLARLSARRRETALRKALGASRWRIVRQSLVESLSLGLLGGAVGLGLAAWGLEALVALSPDRFTRLVPGLQRAGLDDTALLFAVVASLVTATIFGLAPALRSSGWSALTALHRASQGIGPGPAGRRLRNGLLVGQVALAVVLLAATGWTVDGFLYLWIYEPGFETSGVLTFRLERDEERYSALEVEGWLTVQRRLLERLAALPGVVSVAGANRLPAGTPDISGDVVLADSPETERPVRVRPVSGDYFDVLQIGFLSGRPLDTSLAPGTTREEIVINRAAAREWWPDSPVEETLGRRLKSGSKWYEIVGVVEDVRHAGLDPRPRPEYFRVQGDTAFRYYYLLVRTRGDPLTLVPRAREAVWAVDPELPVEEVGTMEQVIAASMALPRFYAFLASVFGGLALLLVTVGVAGVAAYTVVRRTHEIGVRMALGASPGSVLRLITGQGSAVVGTGLSFGLVGAWWVRQFVEGFLYGLTAPRPTTLALVCAGLSLVALVAFVVPARRATWIDPVRVLQDD